MPPTRRYLLAKVQKVGESKGKIFESPFFTIYVLGIGLLCLGKQQDNEFMIETMITMEAFSKDMKDYLKTMLISF